MQIIQYGGLDSGSTILASGNQTVGGVAQSTSIFGTQSILSGGIAFNAQIATGGTQNVGSGGTAVSTSVNGTQNVSGGTASATQVSSGGIQNVSAGGTSINAAVNNGAQLYIGKSGLALSAAVNNGGIVNVGSGGASYFTQINSGGTEIILSGGYGPFATISAGGLQRIQYGGLDSGSTLLKGGSQVVAGVAQSANVYGSQSILFAGVGMNGLVGDNGYVNAASGSYLLGYNLSGSSALILASGSIGASYSGGAGLTVVGQANTITLDGATLTADISISGTRNTLTLQNGVTVANGVNLVDVDNTNTLTINNQSLSIANANAVNASRVNGWNQLNLTNGAAINLAGDLVLGGTNSLINIENSSVISQSPNNVTLGATTISNTGKIAVGAGQTLTLVGSYLQSGGNLQATLGSPTSYGSMLVSGTATLSNASYTIAPDSTLTAGAVYRSVFSATKGFSGTFDTANVFQGVTYAFENKGASLDLVTRGSITPLLNGTQASVVLNQEQATIQLIRDRMGKMDAPAYRGTDERNYFWVTPYGYKATQSANDSPSAAYSQNTTGLAIGIDNPFNEGLRLGAAFIFENSNLTGQNIQTQDGLKVTSYQLAGYAQQKLGESTHLNLIANFAWDQNKSDRVNSLVNDVRLASASYKGWHGLVSGEIDHRIEYGQHTISPLIRFDYGVARIGAYGESGAGLYNVSVDTQTQSSSIASLGLKYRYDINSESRFVARASVGYDFSAKSSSVTATDGFGITFTTQGNNPSALVMQLGLGYEMQTKDNIRMRISYEYLGRNGGYSNNMINASIAVPF